MSGGEKRAGLGRSFQVKEGGGEEAHEGRNKRSLGLTYQTATNETRIEAEGDMSDKRRCVDGCV